LFVVVLAVEVVLLALWQGKGYWDFSDGVYADSARQWLHGLVPYRDFAAAQPPPVYLAGVVLLWIHDGLVSIRLGLGVVDALTSCLVAWCVWRITDRKLPAVIAGLASPLLPISLHEHAQLTPETLASPLLLAGAIYCADRRRAWIGGLLLALAAACKFAFVVPAVAIALACRHRRVAGSSLVLAGGALLGVALAIFGSDLWDGTVQAQLEVGHASLHGAIGLIAQAAWNELPLVALAGAFLWHRTRSQDEYASGLVRGLVAAALSGLLLALTVFKKGSYINVLVVAEAPLLVLAACGAIRLWPQNPRSRILAVISGALLAAQSLSLFVHPADPWIAKRPFASSGLAENASRSAIESKLQAARRCPARLAYSGSPYLAFLSNRRMPGYQPDVFIIENASGNARFLRRAAVDEPRCPNR
jgi:hypothetical protein